MSCARDQIFLVHSMDASDLRSGDLRRVLMEYAASETHAAPLPHETTPFESAVARDLGRLGYALRAPYAASAYPVGMAAFGARGKAAIVCDGERWGLTAAAAAEERRREAVLERMGWTFLHLRGSAYYRDPEGAIERLAGELDALGVPRRAADGEETAPAAPDTDARQRLAARVRARAEELLAAWHAPVSEA